MKKQILLLGLFCFLFVGSQLTYAQTKQKDQSIAVQNTKDTVKKNAENVIAIFERGETLGDSQKNKVYQIFEAVQEKKKNIESVTDEKERKMKTDKLQNFINTKLKDVLSASQYKVYLQAMSR